MVVAKCSMCLSLAWKSCRGKETSDCSAKSDWAAHTTKPALEMCCIFIHDATKPHILTTFSSRRATCSLRHLPANDGVKIDLAHPNSICNLAIHACLTSNKVAAHSIANGEPRHPGRKCKSDLRRWKIQESNGRQRLVESCMGYYRKLDIRLSLLFGNQDMRISRACTPTAISLRSFQTFLWSY